MSIEPALGPMSRSNVRYGFVAFGDKAQETMLASVGHTGNSTLAALVTDDPDEARRAGDHYGVSDIYGYDQFDDMLRSGKVDAIYLATPNWRHAEFAIPALKAGIHVLVEKPLEISLAKTREILDAQKASSAKLMAAYRLHFEPGTLATIDLIRSGELGEILYFNSTFIQPMSSSNNRTPGGVAAGPIFDMGPYPVNATRYVFGAEPIAVVSATASRHPDAGHGDVDDTVSVLLRFPENRLAHFLISFHGNALDSFTVVGSKGSVQMSPAFAHGKPLEQFVTLGDRKTHRSFRVTDHFGGELRYFSDCILHDRDPEPDGEEGYADMRVLDGILRALETGQSVTLEPFTRTKRIDTSAQKMMLFADETPDFANAASPLQGKETVPKI